MSSCFACAGGRKGRGSLTVISALPGGLTVISVVAELTCARGRRREPSEAEGRRGRAWIWMGPPSNLVPVFVIFVPSPLHVPLAGFAATVQFGRDVGRHREAGRRGGEREGDEELHVVVF